MSNQEIESAWSYHELTKHSYESVRNTPHYLDWANMPSPFKVYPELEPIPLPRELIQTFVPALTAIATTLVPRESPIGPGLESLASLLYYTAGVTKSKTYPQHSIYFRAAACAGALYPIETYIVSGDVEGLSAGVYHFNPGDFSLRRLREGDHRRFLSNAASEAQVAQSPFTLIFSAITWRSSWKYRDRSYRYHFWDNGMMLANAFAIASCYGWRAQVLAGFIDSTVNELIGIDGVREFAVSLLPVGIAQGSAAAEGGMPDKLATTVLPLSASQIDYQSIVDMHRASSLATPEEVSNWRRAALNRPIDRPSGDTIPLPWLVDDDVLGVPIEETIQGRASTRRFSHKPLPLEDLAVVLERASRPIPADFFHPDSRLNDIYLIANRVSGLDPGAYFYNREARALELLKSGDFSREATFLALEQDLAGDASVTIFLLTDLARVLDAFGNRGYRAAQLEAGTIGGNLYLGAYGLRRGATGLTFYDDDVTAFFSPHAAGKSCMLVISVGVPGKRPLI